MMNSCVEAIGCGYDYVRTNLLPETNMRRTLLLIAAVLISAGAVQAQSTCRPSDESALQLRGFLRELVSTTDTARLSLRATLGFPAMDSTKVVIVTTNRICANVAQGYNTIQRTPNLVRQLYVISVGTFYAAKDPGHPAGEWWPTVSFNSKYKFVNLLLVP